MMKDRKKEFRKTALEFVEEFMEEQEAIPNGPVTNPVSEEALKKVDDMGIPEKGRNLETVVREMREDILAYGNQCAHPRFFGFIPSTASPLSWLGDVMTTAYNRHAGSADNQPAVWRIEQKLIRWLNDQVGFPAEAGGIFVSGGSMANLTAVTIARDSILPEEEWCRGVAYVSGQTHSSVEKGLRIIGTCSQRIRRIPTDERFRMDVKALQEAIREDLKNGLRPYLVVATAGTTNTGSVDPLRRIRSLCDRYGMWMHVDGAFGASAVLSRKYRHELDGIGTADSLSWDAHKWLFQTIGCSMVLVRSQDRMLESFSVHPEYLKDFEKDSTVINPWDLGIELTRPARCLKLWLTLQVMGSDLVSDSISHGIEIAKWAEGLIRKNPDIQIISPAQMGIINFRYCPADLEEEQADDLNRRISEKMVADGFAGVFTTELNGKKVLRLCILNPEVTRKDVQRTLALMDRYCRELCPADLRRKYVS